MSLKDELVAHRQELKDNRPRRYYATNRMLVQPDHDAVIWRTHLCTLDDVLLSPDLLPDVVEIGFSLLQFIDSVLHANRLQMRYTLIGTSYVLSRVGNLAGQFA